MRRRRPAVPALGAAAHHRGATRADPGGHRPADRRTAGERPGGARVLGVAGGARAGARGAPCRPASGLQGDGRGTLRCRPGEGRVRDRDAGAGDQHAGPNSGPRAPGQVQRRRACRPHARGVHPAHRSGRSARHRRRGPRRGAVGARSGPAHRRRAGLQTAVPAAVLVSAQLQHGGQPAGPDGSAAGPGAARTVLRAVPGQRGGGRRGPAAAAQPAGHRGRDRVADLPPRGRGGVRPAGRRPGPAGEGRRQGQRATPTDADPAGPRPACAGATSWPSPAVGGPGSPSILDPGVSSDGSARPLVLTEKTLVRSAHVDRLPRPRAGAGQSEAGQARRARLRAGPSADRRPPAGPGRRDAARARPSGAPTRRPRSGACGPPMRAHPVHGCADRDRTCSGHGGGPALVARTAPSPPR